jgi:hypothetical protein
MKTLIFIILLLVLGVGVSCQSEKQTDDTEGLKRVLEDYFDGITQRDLHQMNAVTTTDFILFEDGNIWNNDSLVNFLNSSHSFDAKWTFEYVRVNIDEFSGDIVYYNHGDLVFNDTSTIKFDWLESASFRKVDGIWKMDFLHSTIKK